MARSLWPLSVPWLPPRLPRRAQPGPDDLSRVAGLAMDLSDALGKFLGPGCAAAPALTWDETGYHTRAIAFEVPASVADRLVDALRIAKAGERLVDALDTYVIHAGPGRPHASTAGAYSALRAAVRTRAARRPWLS